MRATSSFNSIVRPAVPWLFRGAGSLALLVAAFASTPLTAGINYGRDVLVGTLSADPNMVCTPGCTVSQTCTTLFASSTDPTGTNLCVNNAYPFNFMGNWQALGRAHHVGDVVTDPVTGKAYLYVDVTASTVVTTNFVSHPPLTDTTSWQPFDGLVSDLSGVAGAQGPAGPQGLAGPQGAAGTQGDIGPQGLAGASGAQGPKGDTGPMGPAGTVGPQGSIGPAGPIGPTGSAGPAGNTGPAGGAGPTGPTGPGGFSGPAGTTGATGAAGPAGPSGPAGAQGPAGPITTGNAVVAAVSGLKATPPPAPAGYALLGISALTKSNGAIGFFAIYIKAP